MPMSPEISNGLFALCGAAIGALPGFVSSVMNKRSEERRQFKELVFNAALESYKIHVAAAGNRAMPPLEHYIIHTSKMCEFALAEKAITPDSMKAHLNEVSALMDVLMEHASTPRTKKPA